MQIAFQDDAVDRRTKGTRHHPQSTIWKNISYLGAFFPQQVLVVIVVVVVVEVENAM